MKDYSDLIDDYMAGKLSPKERDQFEQQLAQDPALRDEVNLWREVKDAVSDPALIAFRAAARQGLAQETAPKTKQPMMWAAAVIALLLLLALCYYLFVHQPQQPKSLFAAYFEPEIDFSSERAASMSDSVGQQISQALSSKNYPLMLDLMRAHRPAEYSSAYYLAFGQTWLLNDQSDSAVAYLTKVVAGHEVEKKWFLAMAHLQAGRPSAAKPLLQEVAKGSGPYAAKAHQLLAEMKS